LNLWYAYAAVEISRHRYKSARSVFAHALSSAQSQRRTPGEDEYDLLAGWIQMELGLNSQARGVDLLLQAVDYASADFSECSKISLIQCCELLQVLSRRLQPPASFLGHVNTSFPSDSHSSSTSWSSTTTRLDTRHWTKQISSSASDTYGCPLLGTSAKSSPVLYPAFLTTRCSRPFISG
jgi:hypothetical protein